ncbi:MULTISPECIES: PQQ-dependent sugar dehydrogenase [unclassified Corallococcus]|uniref:PQQ-dependent sugar dehydrogenase n=1 Tax=unclassified Corallococcus TaxID=2685029 RepID=UPI001A8F09F8|nr:MULTISPECIES: PQQ-dependent sugar dehydrogenase [unclassified Corallococcus]MBN9687406.1 PQQ-dependent sugar dehydrogenase [Corallococcus sp. NCSPR001]WAS88772.1 PQQ-dependent sugar dehydrogenase [Corallococcus sp. NCRR]
MRLLTMPLIVATLLVGCREDPEPTSPDSGVSQQQDSGVPESDAGTPDDDAGVPEEPLPSGPPVPQGPPNVPEFQPAFPGQTRVPAIQTKTPLQVTEIASGFRNPWAIAFLPDQRMLVTEKATGSLYIVTQAGAKSAAVSGLPAVDARGQGGLLDVEVGPDYATSQLIYWTYSEPRTGGNGLAVARARLVDGAQPRVENVQIIFRMMPTLESTLHSGGRMVFTPDGKLFVTLGERSIPEGRAQAQDVKSHFGKVVRINPDGSVPQDNPFLGNPAARPEIWSIGHRNVLSAALDSQNRLWTVEMGPQGGDEVNRPEAGKDYGWPTIGYGEDYSGLPMHQSTQAPGMEQPVYYWDPVIAPSGMTFYSGTLIPEWRGDMFIGGLASQALVRLMVRDDRVVGEEHLLKNLNARIREVVQGPEGALYLLTDATNGKVLKVTPK